MSKRSGPPGPRLAAFGISVSALAVVAASAAVLLTQGCTETSAKKPTTSTSGPGVHDANAPASATAPTNLPPPPT